MSIVTFVDLSAPTRDDRGASTALHTDAERKAYLKRNPGIDPTSLPPVRNVNARPTISDAIGTVNGLPVRTPERIRKEAAQEAALLRDPIKSVRKHEPTRPVVRPEPAISLYRSAIHEVFHLLTSFSVGVPVARISLIKDGDTLGHIKHGNLPDSEEHLAILLGGRAGELIEFADVRMAGCEDDMQKAHAMATRLVGAGGANELIEKTLQRVVNMLRGEKNTARYLAYELIRKRQIDFEEVDAAIDRAFGRSEKKAAAKAAPTKGHSGRTYDLHDTRDLADFNAKWGRAPDADPIGFAPGYISRVNK